jgi:hypothetical protein
LATPRRRPRRRNGIDASLIRSGHVPSTPPTDEPSLQDFRAWRPTRLVVLLSLSRCAAAAMGDELLLGCYRVATPVGVPHEFRAKCVEAVVTATR